MTAAPTATPLSFVPGAPREPQGNISRSVLWVYGEPKIGKTTFASKFPGAWFIATERGQEWVTVREPTYIETWQAFLTLCQQIADHKPTTFQDGALIQTLILDTYDGLFKMCYDSVCVSMGVSDPGEIPHGGGWGRLDKEFSRVMSKVALWPYGLVCISHCRTREFKTKGRKTDRIEPNVGAAGTRWAQGAADLIMFCHADEEAEINDKGEVTGRILERRRIQVHPNAAAVAGGRMAHLLPRAIDLDYDEFTKYFEGESASDDNSVTDNNGPTNANIRTP